VTLWAAVDGLVKPRHVKLLRDTGAADWTTVPPLWQQLEAALTCGMESGKAARSTVHRVPLNVGAYELAADIRDILVDALAGHDEKPLRDGPTTKQLAAIAAQRAAERTYGLYVIELTPLPPQGRILVPASLRHLASIVTAIGDEDLIGWWIYRVTSWSRQIIHVLRLEEAPQPRRIRDTSCPMCAATHVTTRNPDGEKIREPALLIDFTDGMVRAASCSACGASWFRGDALVDLADLIATTRRLPSVTAVDGLQ
jgi:hypothetical protein